MGKGSAIVLNWKGFRVLLTNGHLKPEAMQSLSGRRNPSVLVSALPGRGAVKRQAKPQRGRWPDAPFAIPVAVFARIPSSTNALPWETTRCPYTQRCLPSQRAAVEAPGNFRLKSKSKACAAKSALRLNAAPTDAVHFIGHLNRPWHVQRGGGLLKFSVAASSGSRGVSTAA